MAFNLMMTPPRFNSGDDLSEFLKVFNSYCGSVDASDDVKRHLFLDAIDRDLKWKIQGKDKNIYDISYKTLVERAFEAINGAEFSHTLRLELIQRVQLPQEDARNFVYALKALGDRCYPEDEDSQLKNELLYLCLIKGLRDKQLASSIPVTLRYERKFMEAADVIFKAVFEICPSVGVESIQTCSATPSTTDLSVILSKLRDMERETKAYQERNGDTISELRGDLRRVNDRMDAVLCNSVYRDDNQCLSTNNARRRRKCFGCGSVRHLVKECPKRIRSLDNSIYSSCKGRRVSTPMNNLAEGTSTIKLENVVVTGHKERADLHRFVTMVFRDKPVCALVDTGASVSLIKKSLWDGLSSAEKGPLSASPKGTRFVGADGSDLSILGKGKVSFSLGTLAFEVDLLVCSNIGHDLIVGLDFLQSHHCALCYNSMSLSIGEIEVPLLTQPIIPKRNEIFITESEVVPASSEIRVLAKLTNHVGGDNISPPPVCVERNVEFNAIQDSTGLSPHYLLTGRMLKLPADLQGKNVAAELSLETEMDALRDRLLLADQVTDEVLGEQRAKMKRQHDKQCHGKEISVGDRVFLNNPAVPVDRCRKFHLPYKEPYKVVRKVGQVNYQVEDDHGKKQTVHYNRLKRVSKDVNRLEESVES